MEDRTIKDIVIGAFLTVGGCFAIWQNETDLAGVCLGALAGYVLKNGNRYLEKKAE